MVVGYRRVTGGRHGYLILALKPPVPPLFTSALGAVVLA